MRCCVGCLPYATHFQIYVVLEVVDVVLEVYYTQHTFKYMLCWRYYMLCWMFTIHNKLSNICCVGGARCCVGGLIYTTHFDMLNYISNGKILFFLHPKSDLRCHWSEIPLVRNPISPKSHWSENCILQVRGK